MMPTYRRNLSGVPEHYRLTIQGVTCDVHDVVDALNPPHYVAEALTYLMRYKRKPSENPDVDLQKAAHVLLRQIFRGNPERAAQSLRTLSDVAKELADLRESLNAQQAKDEPECRQEKADIDPTQKGRLLCSVAMELLEYKAEASRAVTTRRISDFLDNLGKKSTNDEQANESAQGLYDDAPERIRVVVNGFAPSDEDEACALHAKSLAEYRTRFQDVYSAYTSNVRLFRFSERLIAKDVLCYTDEYADRMLAKLSNLTSLAKLRVLMAVYSKYTMILKSLAVDGPSRDVLHTFHDDHLQGTYTEQTMSTFDGALDVLGGVCAYAYAVLREFTAFAKYAANTVRNKQTSTDS